MAEIIRTYKQPVPAMRFIGKNYGNSQHTNWMTNWENAISFDVLGKVQRASSGEKGSLSLYEDYNSYISLYYRNTKTCAHDAWIGMFTPPETKVGDGLGYLDFPEQSLGVCWIYGKQNEVHNVVSQCLDKIISAGMEIQSDEHGCIGFFERDQPLRFDKPDDKGNIIIDYCYFVV